MHLLKCLYPPYYIDTKSNYLADDLSGGNVHYCKLGLLSEVSVIQKCALIREPERLLVPPTFDSQTSQQVDYAGKTLSLATHRWQSI